MLSYSDVATRGEALAKAQTLLKTLVDGIKPADMPRYATQVLDAWAARLRAEGELGSFYPVPKDVSAALEEISSSLGQIGPDALIDWIDLIGQTVLGMVEIQSVIREVPTVVRACGPANYTRDQGTHWDQESLSDYQILVPMEHAAAA